MSSFRFIHCSDLHIDSPFKGLKSNDPQMAQRLRLATSKAFSNIVEIAIREQVDAVLIAGDVFDGEDKSLQAQLRFRDALVRLSQENIPSFIAVGNHDPLNSWSRSWSLPDKVTLFHADSVQRVPVRKAGREIAAIYGISFPKKDVSENLALQFQKQDDSGLAIGLLHTNVGGNADHDNYAPCSVDDLVKAGMDYWALGHIHLRQVLRESDPAIVYCGNSQARHFKEAAPKGCCLVTLKPGVAPDIEFVAADVVRLRREVVDVSGTETFDLLRDALQELCSRFQDEAEERDLVLELTLRGRTPLHAELQYDHALEDLASYLQELQGGSGPEFYLQLKDETQGLHDLDRLRQGNDFTADVIALYDEKLQSVTEENMFALLGDLAEQREIQSQLKEMDLETLRRVLTQARDHTLDFLLTDS